MEQHFLELETDGWVQRFDLSESHACTIGRNDQNTIVLNDDGVSRYHALIQSSGPGCFLITDRNSSNGTFVNGSRIPAPAMLESGDRITIGSRELVFQSTCPELKQPVADPSGEGYPTEVSFSKQLITVLVVDIRDFTGLAQRVAPETLAQIARTFFRGSGQILSDCGAAAQKYIGDAVMAIWRHKGFVVEADDMANVLRSVWRLSELASGLQQQLHLHSPIRIGAGLNSGLASVGNVGGMASSDYTAMGDVVNRAFRLESCTKEIAVDLVLGETTYQFLTAITGPLDALRSYTVQLKGYSAAAPVYGAAFPSLENMIRRIETARLTRKTASSI
jgi:adenylate cyclase